jgi:hypothetical protein
MSSETWGAMTEDERKQFTRSWRAWRERAWQASQYARGLTREERRVLFAIIDRVRLGDSADADGLIATIGAAEIARLLDIHVSTVGSIRQRLRAKGILIHSSATGGRKMEAQDQIALRWIESSETEIKTRVKPKRKLTPNRAGVSGEKLTRNGAGVSADEQGSILTPSEEKLTPFDPKTHAFSAQNSRPAGRDALDSSYTPSDSSSAAQHPAARVSDARLDARQQHQPDQPVPAAPAPTPRVTPPDGAALAKGSAPPAGSPPKPIEAREVENRLQRLCLRLNPIYRYRLDAAARDALQRMVQSKVSQDRIRAAIADHVGITAIAGKLVEVAEEDPRGVDQLKIAIERARAHQAAYKPAGQGPYALRKQRDHHKKNGRDGA